MEEHFVLEALRSDGVRQVQRKDGSFEANSPPAEKLKRIPDSHGVLDYYRELTKEDAKYQDWKKKLGGMLLQHVRECYSHDARLGNCQDPKWEKWCVLLALPEGYRLYEHIKTRVQDSGGKSQKTAKAHAGGGHDRQDAYLYGHPGGPRKRYRSPAEFFPHLKWLCTDAAYDRGNCACRLCTPDEVQPPASKEVKNADKDGKAKGPSQTPQQLQPAKPSTNTLKRSDPPAPSGPPTGAAVVRSADQAIDFQYGRFVFRQGEQVWYLPPHMKQGWALGVITQRWEKSNNPPDDRAMYYVQQLSYPFDNQSHASIVTQTQLRPYYAWSTPHLRNMALNGTKVRFDTADWQGISEGRYGQGGQLFTMTDASILASKKIDHTYTLAGQFKTLQTDDGATLNYWNCIYLGAEKLWVGDTARIVWKQANADAEVVLVIQDIVDRSAYATPGDKTPVTSVSLIGDVYILHHVPAGQALPSTDPSLPQRMKGDVAARNAALTSPGSAAPPANRAAWSLLARSQPLAITDVRGRWYEASVLLPLLKGRAVFDAERAAKPGGAVESVGAMLNQWAGNTQGPTNERMARVVQREEAWGQAVPLGTACVEGLVPRDLQPDGMAPVPQGVTAAGASVGGAGQVGAAVQAAAEQGGIDEFMDFDAGTRYQ